MDAVRKFLSPITDRLADRSGGGGPAKEKKWLAYGGMLIFSLILFFSMGSKRRYSDSSTSEGVEEESGTAFREMSEQLAVVQSGMASYSVGTEDEVVPVYSTWGRDPFISGKESPGTSETTREPDLLLTAISWKDDDAVVLINDSVLRRGDDIDGAEVVSIHQDSVVLKRGRGKIVLNLEGGDDVE